MNIGQGSQEPSGRDLAEPGQIRGLCRRDTSPGTAPLKNQRLPPFAGAQRGETVRESSARGVGETEPRGVVGRDSAYWRDHGGRVVRVQMGLRQPVNRFLGFLRRRPLEYASGGLRVHPAVPSQVLDEQKRVDIAGPGRGEFSDEGDDSGIGWATEQRHADIGTVELGNGRCRPPDGEHVPDHPIDPDPFAFRETQPRHGFGQAPIPGDRRVSDDVVGRDTSQEPPRRGHGQGIADMLDGGRPRRQPVTVDDPR